MESNGKLPHIFILSKTATLVPEFTVEDLHSFGQNTLMIYNLYSVNLENNVSPIPTDVG